MRTFKVTYQINEGPKADIEVFAFNSFTAGRSAIVDIAEREELSLSNVTICNIQMVGAEYKGREPRTIIFNEIKQ